MTPLAAAPTHDEIDNAIDAWDASDSELPLHDYLGWEWREYSHFVSDGDIPQRPLRRHP